MSRADALRIPDYLGHIVEAIERIHRYVAEMDEVGFLNDEKTRDAVIRNFEVLGEAARNLERHHAVYTEAHPDIPWALMVALRNRVAHGYFQVDYALVWKTLHRELPALHADIQALLDGQP